MPESVKPKPIWAYGGASPHPENYIQALRKLYRSVESYIKLLKKLFLGVESYTQVWWKLYLWVSHWSTSPSGAHPGVTRLKTWQHHFYPIAPITSPFWRNIREEHYGSIPVSHGTAERITASHGILPHGTYRISILPQALHPRSLGLCVQASVSTVLKLKSSKVHASLSVKSPWFTKFKCLPTHVVYNTIHPPKLCIWYRSITDEQNAVCLKVSNTFKQEVFYSSSAKSSAWGSKTKRRFHTHSDAGFWAQATMVPL